MTTTAISFSTRHFDYTHAQWGEIKYDQVAVRHWMKGKVVKRRF